VAQQAEALGAGLHAPGDGGERALALRPGHGAGGGLAEQAGMQGGGVGVGDDGVRLDAFAIGETEAGAAAALGEDLRNLGIVAEGGAAPAGQGFQGAGDAVHAAFHQPAPCCSTWAISIRVAGASKGEAPQ
jgi:hypothetical protein